MLCLPTVDVIAPVIVVNLCVVVVTPRDVDVFSVVIYEGSMRGVLGCVPHGYDAIIVIN